jgi:hypothetical protein
MTQTEYQEHQLKMAKNRRLQIMAIAALQRSKEAGIPEEFRRIGKNEFKKLLCPRYKNPAGSVDEIANKLYDNPDEIIKKYQFFLIDGGDKIERKMAGFAILFRLIALERNGKYELSDTFIHTIEDYSGRSELSRNQYLEEISLYDSLFISEFHTSKINPKKEAGSFFDEVFQIREDFKRPTIISFQDPISGNEELKDESKGLYFRDFSRSEKSKPMRNALRIRVQVKGDL